MTYKERTKAVCASILLILKNATVIVPVIEGIIYTIWDIIHSSKKKKNEEKIQDAEIVADEISNKRLSEYYKDIEKD